MSTTLPTPPTPVAAPKRGDGETTFWQRCDAFVQYMSDLGTYLVQFVTAMTALVGEVIGYRDTAVAAALAAQDQAELATTNGAAQVALATDQVALATAQTEAATGQADRSRDYADRALALAGTAITGTSATSLTVATGDQVLSTGAALAFVPGCRCELCASADPVNVRMSGVVRSYDATTGGMTLFVDTVSGAGTYTAWSVRIVSDVTAQSIRQHFWANS